MYKLYQFTLPSIAESKNFIYNKTKFNIFGDKYLSQGLIAILRKTRVTAAEREVGERGGRGDTRENTYHSEYEALTQCCSTIGLTSSTSAPHKNNIGSMPG